MKNRLFFHSLGFKLIINRFFSWASLGTCFVYLPANSRLCHPKVCFFLRNNLIQLASRQTNTFFHNSYKQLKMLKTIHQYKKVIETTNMTFELILENFQLVSLQFYFQNSFLDSTKRSATTELVQQVWKTPLLSDLNSLIKLKKKIPQTSFLASDEGLNRNISQIFTSFFYHQ